MRVALDRHVLIYPVCHGRVRINEHAALPDERRCSPAAAAAAAAMEEDITENYGYAVPVITMLIVVFVVTTHILLPLFIPFTVLHLFEKYGIVKLGPSAEDDD
ncbi:unnamed protein product [Soboliphyme baturini]|uniref:Transmembrane protein n=1 Tax=Soboliphyme baturini TaxID=241478 RepID=A0A183JAE5_9BILA|nr:unnamed protein product [Soboliphyme baturini]